MWEIYATEPVWNDFSNTNWEKKKELIEKNHLLIKRYTPGPTRCYNKED